MMRKLLPIILLILFTGSVAPEVIASGMEGAFEKGRNVQGQIQFGSPPVSSLTTGGNTSSLEKMGDSELMSGGSSALGSSSTGKFIQEVELRKIEAINRHKINQDNSWLKNSFELEEDPASKTGGKGIGSSKVSSSTVQNKSCLEGADFQINVGYELVLEAEEKEEIIRKPQTSINLPARKIPEIFWEKKPQSYMTTDNELMSGVKYILSNTVEAHRAIKEAISQSVGNLSPESIELPLQNVFIFYPGSNNVIIPQGAEIFKNPAIKYRTSAAELARLAYNQVTVILYYSIIEIRKKFIEKDEYWQISTQALAEVLESNDCYEIARTCTHKDAKIFFGKHEVRRPCWYEDVKYQCTGKPKDGCAHLDRQGCRLIDSVCEKKIGDICFTWNRNYACAEEQVEERYSAVDSSIYCLGGNCHSVSLEQNKDIGNVAILAALNEAKKDCVSERGMCASPVKVFPGSVDACKRIITGAINCCSSFSGWAKSMRLSSCSGEEKALAIKKEKDLCHEVGTYCHERIARVCVERRTKYCCFSSKLAKVFQEQAKAQLSLSWGSAEFPSCDPLTIEQLRSLDFSKFDMEALFDGMIADAKSKMGKAFSGHLAATMPSIQKNHMATTPMEKRDFIRRKAEEEERARRAKEEEKRLAEEARLKAQQEKVRLAEEARARKEREKILEEERIRRQQEQLRIAEENRIKREQALALHKQNELVRLRQEKQAWYNNYIANMDAGRNPTHVTQRLWYQFFGITPQEYINNPNYTANTAISRYGVNIVPPYQFIPRPFE